MPHIIIEHSINCFQRPELTLILETIQRAVMQTALFDARNIKVRLHPVTHFLLDTNYAGFAHIQCRIHEGRSESEKQKLSQTLSTFLHQQVNNNTFVTVEIVEMETASYAKCVSE